jgi:DNA-binding protein HU-beta
VALIFKGALLFALDRLKTHAYNRRHSSPPSDSIKPGELIRQVETREESMTKSELIEAVLKTKGLPEMSKKATGEVIDAVFTQLSKAIKKEKRFSYPGFGTFTVKRRKARKGRNPRTGEEIKIAATKTVSFKPAPQLKKIL